MIFNEAINTSIFFCRKVERKGRRADGVTLLVPAKAGSIFILSLSKDRRVAVLANKKKSIM
jgi:hypothetical protein